MRNIFTKTVAVMAMIVTTVTAGAINIPQVAVGDYILIGDASTNPKTTAEGVTLTNCQVDGSSATSYTIGSTGSKTQIDFALNATEAGDYLFSFMSGSEGYTAKLSLSLKNLSAEEIWSGTTNIINTGEWTLTTRHLFAVGNLSVGTYTMTIKVIERAQDGGTKNYAGNYGNFCFHTATQYPWPSSSNLDLQHGTFNRATWNSDGVISYIKAAGASIDNLLVYNNMEDFYTCNFNISNIKQNSLVGVTITDIATGSKENRLLEVSANGDKTIHWGKKLTAGWKKIRFDFSDNEPGNVDEHLFNFQNVTMPSRSYDALPQTGTAVLDMSSGSMTSGSNPRYSSSSGTNNEISYISNGGYADEFYVNNPVTAIYELKTITSNYRDGGTFKVTITDVVTGMVEINAQESENITSNNQNISIRLNNTLTQGIKKIRFDFVNTSANSWLYNIKDVSFSFVNYTRPFAHMNLNTLCFPYQIDSYTGATFYTIQETEVSGGELTKLVLEEHVGVLEAGVPYFYDPDPEASELVCTFNGDYTDIQPGAGGLTGSYADDSPVPANKYVTVNNMLYKTGDNVTMAEYRAYVDPVAYSRPAMAGRKRRTIGRYDAPTAVESIQKSEVSVQKVIRNGQFLIIRDGVEYNATGQILK